MAVFLRLTFFVECWWRHRCSIDFWPAVVNAVVLFPRIGCAESCILAPEISRKLDHHRHAFVRHPAPRDHRRVPR